MCTYDAVCYCDVRMILYLLITGGSIPNTLAADSGVGDSSHGERPPEFGQCLRMSHLRIAENMLVCDV